MRSPSRINSCRGKVIYGSWALALKEARRVNRKHDETLAPYACSICGGVHMAVVDPAHKDRRPRDD